MTPEELTTQAESFAKSEATKLMDKIFKDLDSLSSGDLIVELVTATKTAIYLAYRAQRAAELQFAAIQKGLPEYRGVYRAGDSYQRGAWVSWGGSVWAAARDVQGIAPSNDTDAWIKAIARGNAGASAYESAKRCGFNGSEADWVRSLMQGNR